MVCLYCSPGFKTVDGKLGWLGVSGKNCGSKHKAGEGP